MRDKYNRIREGRAFLLNPVCHFLLEFENKQMVLGGQQILLGSWRYDTKWIKLLCTRDIERFRVLELFTSLDVF